MISLTCYYQLFEKDINVLKEQNTEDEKFQSYMQIANEMLPLGYQLEETDSGLTVKSIGGQIREIAEKFNNNVAMMVDGKNTRRQIPKIEGKEQLLFAIVYHKYLIIYNEVGYQGNVQPGMFSLRGRVESGVQEKKKSTNAQAEKLKENILAFCEANNIALTEQQLLPEVNYNAASKKEEEQSLVVAPYDAEAYVQGLKAIIFNSAKEEQQETEQAEQEQAETIDSLNAKLTQKKEEVEGLEKAYDEEQAEFKSLSLKIQAKSGAADALHEKVKNVFLITRLFYQLFSFIHKAKILKDIESDEANFNTAKAELNAALDGKNIADCLDALNTSLQEKNLAHKKAESEKERLQQQLNAKKEEQAKLEEQERIEREHAEEEQERLKGKQQTDKEASASAIWKEKKAQETSPKEWQSVTTFLTGGRIKVTPEQEAVYAAAAATAVSVASNLF